MKNNLEVIKTEIENLININDLENAKLYLEKYGVLSNEDISYFSMKGIIAIRENNLSEAVDSFLKAFEIDNSNVDVLYNMGYLNVLLGNLQDALYFYDRCIALSNDNDLIQEVISIKNDIENTLNEKIYTFVMINIDKDDDIFNNVHNKKNSIIRLSESKDIEKANIYIDNNIKVYDVNPKEINVMIEYIIRNNDNVVLIFNDYNKYDNVMNFKDRAKIIYYSEANYYIDYMDRNYSLFVEKQACENVDFIVTKDIKVYNYKKIIERRNNVFFIDKNINETFALDCILNNKVNYSIKDYLETIDDEAKRFSYSVGLCLQDDKERFNLSEYVYNNFNNEEAYNIYLSLIMKQKDYIKLKKVVINSCYCDEIYKVEVVYWFNKKERELLEFIVNISIKNFLLADVDNKNHIDYVVALLNYESTKYDASYEKYLDILSSENCYSMSPLFNRNISYLMYINKNSSYKTYFDKYKRIVFEYNIC